MDAIDFVSFFTSVYSCIGADYRRHAEWRFKAVPPGRLKAKAPSGGKRRTGPLGTTCEGRRTALGNRNYTYFSSRPLSSDTDTTQTPLHLFRPLRAYRLVSACITIDGKNKYTTASSVCKQLFRFLGRAEERGFVSRTRRARDVNIGIYVCHYAMKRRSYFIGCTSHRNSGYFCV